jgi:hypothetical protein
MSKTVCDFGCGRDATKQLKNGRFVCAEFVAQCPAMRVKNGRQNVAGTCSRSTSRIRSGRVAERTIAVLLKSTEAARLPWVRIPPLPLKP